MKFEIRKIKLTNGLFKSYGYEYIELNKRYSFDDSISPSHYDFILQKILSYYKKHNSIIFPKDIKKIRKSRNLMFFSIENITLEYGDIEIIQLYYQNGLYAGYMNLDFIDLDTSNPFFIVSDQESEESNTMFQIICLLE